MRVWVVGFVLQLCVFCSDDVLGQRVVDILKQAQLP